VEPRVYRRGGFAVTLWTYYEPATRREVSPAGYARALQRLHAGMRMLEVPAPHFTDRVGQARHLVALADADRELLGNTLGSPAAAPVASAAALSRRHAALSPRRNAAEPVRALLLGERLAHVGELRTTDHAPSSGGARRVDALTQPAPALR